MNNRRERAKAELILNFGVWQFREVLMYAFGRKGLCDKATRKEGDETTRLCSLSRASNR